MTVAPLLLPPAHRPGPARATRTPEDPAARLAAEREREHAVLIAMREEQRKRDDEFLRKWIALI